MRDGGGSLTRPVINGGSKFPSEPPAGAAESVVDRLCDEGDPLYARSGANSGRLERYVRVGRRGRARSRSCRWDRVEKASVRLGVCDANS
jgi:hypothetical protein